MPALAGPARGGGRGHGTHHALGPPQQLYTLTKYLPEMLLGLIATAVFGIAPGLGGIVGSGNLGMAARLRGEMAAGTWLIATALGASVIVWNRSFVNLWVGPSHYAGSTSTLLNMLMTAQLVLIRNDSNLIDLTLKLNRKVVTQKHQALLDSFYLE